MKQFVLLLGVATLAWAGFSLAPAVPWGSSGDSSPTSVEILSTDPGDVMAIKFLALYAQGNAHELQSFAARVRANPQTQEWEGVGPAAAEWRSITQEVLKSSQEGLARKVLQMQDTEVGWDQGGQDLEAIAAGWSDAANELARMAEQRSRNQPQRH